MKISSKSWHYRWLRFCGVASRYTLSGPKSLCTYFWLLLSTLLFVTVMSVVLLGMIIILVAAAITHPHEGLIAGGTVGTIILIGGLIIWRADAIQNWIDAYAERQFAKDRAKDKNPNVVWEFIKAKKRKVCPLIEYTHD